MIDFSPPESPFRISYDGDFDISRAVTAPPPDASNRAMKKELKRTVREISRLQRHLHAHRHYAVLLVFQAMDAAGKDSTLRAVMTGVNPAGFRINAFEAPSNEEAGHDFLWRTTRRLPEKGRIGIFNRSYYEEVLIVRVHPEYLERQKLPRRLPILERCEERYQSIRDHEAHLARNGTVILKFWLNISKEEQARRFLRRIDRPDKNWKFSPRRHRGAAALGRVHGRLRGRDQRDRPPVGAVVRNPRRLEALHAPDRGPAGARPARHPRPHPPHATRRRAHRTPRLPRPPHRRTLAEASSRLAGRLANDEAPLVSAHGPCNGNSRRHAPH